MIASNLSRSRVPGVAQGLKRLSACLSAVWRTIQVEDVGLGGRVRISYRLSIIVNIRYGDSIVYTHRFDTPEQHIAMILKTQQGTFDPATDRTQGKDPYALLMGEKKLWSKLGTFPATHGIVNPSLRKATVTAVESKLRLLQRAFYAEVAQRCARAGDPIQQFAQRLTGSKLLWQSFVATGTSAVDRTERGAARHAVR